MKKLLFLLFFIPLMSIGQTLEEKVIGSCRANQFQLIQISENEYKFYIESYRRITNGGWSDRRYNYTTQAANFTADKQMLTDIYNRIKSVIGKEDKVIIELGKHKLTVSNDGSASATLKLKGTRNYISEYCLDNLFKDSID